MAVFAMQPSPKIVALRYARLTKRADLSPPLGYPGGSCHVIRRIRQNVGKNPLADMLVDDVESGEDLTNPEAAKVYPVIADKAPERSLFRRVLIKSHAQYRMDQRGITVPEIRVALLSFNKAFLNAKSRNDGQYKQWVRDLKADNGVRWTDQKIGLTIVFGVDSDLSVRLVTAYWSHGDDPAPMDEAFCR